MTTRTTDRLGPWLVATDPPALVDPPSALAGTPYRARVVGLLATGHAFAGISATPDGTGLRVQFAAADGAIEVVTVATDGGAVPSIVDLVPAAWDEREAHDVHRIGFEGHDPLRPLVHHGELAGWTVPVRGDDTHQVAVGPIHAGVIESGHFRFHLVGEKILHLDARLFYKHRGLERAARGRALAAALPVVERACAACSVANGVAYAHAAEEAQGLVPTADLSRVRTVLLELERVWNHLNDIGAVCAGVGMAAGNTRFSALTDRARRLNADLAGHRFLFGTVRVGSSTLTADIQQVRALRAELAQLRREAETSWRELIFNTSFTARLPQIGVVTADDVRRLGTVGPAARAAGVPDDVRAGSPRLAYEAFATVVVERAEGDVQARLEQRAIELWQSFDLLDQLLDRPLEAAAALPNGPAHRLGTGRVESPRGATGCLVEWDGERVEAVRLRTGSFANWPSVAYAAAGNLLPDFPLINKSFELCYACTDR